MKEDVVNAQVEALNSAELQAKKDALGASYDGGHAAGFQEGVASVPVGTGGGFSQADMDKAVADATGPLNQQITDLTVKDASDIAAGQAALVELQSRFDELSKKEAVEAGTLQSLQSAKDALAKVLADLSGIGAPVPPPQPDPQPTA